MADSDRLVVITGGPGSGKSTLAAALSRRGVRCMPEGGRAIIQDQLAIGGNALPWGDRKQFAELMLAWDLRSYREAQARGAVVVFDRGIPDIVGCLKLCGLPSDSHFESAARTFRYRGEVFIAPPWPEIFAQDAGRRQSLEEAEATFHALAAAYTRHGYDLVQLPRAPVEARVDFLLARLRGV